MRVAEVGGDKVGHSSLGTDLFHHLQSSFGITPGDDDTDAQHALAIVDRDGLAGLTMRSLAASPQTGPMTLYNYVESREALEELVVDAVSARVALPGPTDDWLAETRAVATALWRTYRAHPAVIPLILPRRTSSRASLVPTETLAAALARGGLKGVDLFVAFRAVSAFVTGIAQNELAGALTREKDPASAAAHRSTCAGRTTDPRRAGPGRGRVHRPGVRADVPASSATHHWRVLRESGVLFARRQGRVIRDDLDARFPGLLDAVLAAMASGGHSPTMHGTR
ncbi:TetR/AcrR family transcriptional regulator C-terminal domain-containing protein [Micromonospora sp. NPDC049171]|uniref:TetR/AcrR family transcriptional regulator C-terminal domain-containing protein n=1 Tax=Micromonospora sp. NPDC049171 TaxID=3155770 RepID=UPI0033F6B395